MANFHLILGGARSGKSTHAEALALAARARSEKPKKLTYIATATAGDDEMSERIKRHKLRRSEQWLTIEEPLDLASAISKLDDSSIVLIDCLTLWLSNCLHANCWDKQKTMLLNALAQSKADIIMVSNEVGSGIVPMGELSRQFVDESGWLHQELAQLCENVSLIIAGLPLSLKPNTIQTISNFESTEFLAPPESFNTPEPEQTKVTRE